MTQAAAAASQFQVTPFAPCSYDSTFLSQGSHLLSIIFCLLTRRHFYASCLAFFSLSLRMCLPLTASTIAINVNWTPTKSTPSNFRIPSNSHIFLLQFTSPLPPLVFQQRVHTCALKSYGLEFPEGFSFFPSKQHCCSSPLLVTQQQASKFQTQNPKLSPVFEIRTLFSHSQL